MNSDISMRTSACSSSNRNAASALVSSVLPTPVGPRNMNHHRELLRQHTMPLQQPAIGVPVLRRHDLNVVEQRSETGAGAALPGSLRHPVSGRDPQEGDD